MREKYDVVHAATAHEALDARIFYKEAKSAAQLGFKTAVIGPHNGRTCIDGVDILPIKKSPIRLLRRLIGPIAVLRVVLSIKVKIFHFHDPEIIPVAILLKLLGVKVVYDIHEYYSVIHSIRVENLFLRKIIRTLMHIAVEKLPCLIFDRAVFPTNGLKAVIAPTGKSASLINMLPLSVIPSGRRGVNKDYDVVFMGTISPFRAEPLMEMFSYVLEERPTATLLMLGTKDETISWMRANAPSQQVLDAITFHPRVSHSEVFEVLMNARVGFNFHPMWEQFEVAIPMKVYEYMACRLPVVTTSFPELEEQLLSGSEIIMPIGNDQRKYAESVLKLLRDPDYASKIAEAGFFAVANRLNWDASEVEKLKDLYKSLL